MACNNSPHRTPFVMLGLVSGGARGEQVRRDDSESYRSMVNFQFQFSSPILKHQLLRRVVPCLALRHLRDPPIWVNFRLTNPEYISY